jgi:hypothetical protein
MVERVVEHLRANILEHVETGGFDARLRQQRQHALTPDTKLVKGQL